MFRPKPFKDAEKNPEAPKLDSHRFFGLVFSFLWFYRRVFVGLILLVGLGFLIYRITTTSKEPDDLGSPVALGPQRSLEPKIPKANLDFEPANRQPTTTENIGSNDSASDLLGSNSDGESGSETDLGVESLNVDFNPIESLPEDATVDELIETSLGLRDSWGKATPSVGLMMCALRAKISRRLMEMEITESQHKFAAASYIESISLVDSLNVTSKMNIDGTREALLEIDETYSDDPDSTLSAKANLAMVLAPVYECMASKNPEFVEAINQEFNNRFEKIFADTYSTSRLAEVSLAMSKKPKIGDATQPFMTNFLRRLSESESSKIVTIGKLLKDRLLFEKFELKSLPSRLDEPEMRSTVQEFFETLAANPDSASPIYQAAVTTIVRYQVMGKSEDATALINWLEEIASTITNEQKKQAVRLAIDKMRKKHGLPEVQP